MGIVLDLIVILIVGFLVVGGYRRGAIQAVVNLAATAVAGIGAVMISSMISLDLYLWLLKDQVIKVVSDCTPVLDAQAKAAEISGQLSEGLPSYLQNALNMMGVSTAKLEEEIAATSLSIPELLEGLVRPVLVKLVTVVAAMVLFVVFLCLIFIFTKTVKSFVDHVGLGKLDRVLGVMLGLTEAVIIVMLLTMFIYFAQVVMPVDAAQGLRDGINESFIYKYIYFINLPDMIMSGLISFT